MTAGDPRTSPGATVPGLDALILRIREGKDIVATDLLACLTRERVSERYMANMQIARAFMEAGDLARARPFAQRAWMLSGFDERLWPVYHELHAALGDGAAIQSAWKRIGMRAASEGRIADALEAFHQGLFAHGFSQGEDRYEYDIDVLDRIKAMGEPHRFQPGFQDGVMSGRKLRLAYLVAHAGSAGSVLVRIQELLARCHDASRFEVAFFVPESGAIALTSAVARETVERLQVQGWPVIFPGATSATRRLLEVADAIHGYQPDLLIANALLADMRQYFITMLRPAPAVLGFHLGPPAQFVTSDLDWSIAFTQHPLVDCPCDCSRIDFEMDMPERRPGGGDRDALGLPEGVRVLASAGRFTKFRDPVFWDMILSVLKANPLSVFLALGIDQPPPCLVGRSAPELQDRIRFLGWREDYRGILSAADVVIDTYPSGGGLTILDAMAMGISVVTFRNDSTALFDQTAWSPGEELTGIPDLIVERGHVAQFEAVVSRLLSDPEHRGRMANACFRRAHDRYGHPERMVRRCEAVYRRVVESAARSGRPSSQGPRLPRPSGLAVIPAAAGWLGRRWRHWTRR